MKSGRSNTPTRRRALAEFPGKRLAIFYCMDARLVEFWSCP
ncbi:MAG: hypothetical protein R3C68_13485 [Myxococcota bacterium]